MPLSRPTGPAAPPAPAVVLDTNVVLDWLFFDDPRCRALAEAIRTGSLRWITAPSMRIEIERVLTRVPFSSRPDAAATVLRGWDRWASAHPDVASTALPGCRCTDADDQKFIDLALHLGAATLLVSRDRAVLRLARAAARWGVRIESPNTFDAAGAISAALSG